MKTGICEVLIPLTNSASSEVQGNSAAAIGNLSSKDGRRTASDDYSAFNEVWDKPEGGMRGYLYRFTTSSDATFQHIAVWTIVQLLESGDPHLITNIRSSPLLVSHIRQLATSPDSTPSSSVGTPDSVRSRSDQDSDSDSDEGQEDIHLLSRRILEFIDVDVGLSTTHSVTPSQGHAFGSVNGSVTGGEHGELRRSVPNISVPRFYFSCGNKRNK